VATSPAFRGRPIGRADGPDRASRGHFSKKALTFQKSTRGPESLSGYFAKNSSYFFEINPQSSTDVLRVFYKKNLTFFGNQPALHKPSHHFYEILLGFFSNQRTVQL